MMRSLQARLSLGLIISLIFLFGLQWLVVRATLSAMIENYVELRLVHDAENLLSRVRFDQNGALELPPEHINSIYHPPFSGHYYLLISGPHTLRSRSLWDADLSFALPDVGQTITTWMSGPQNQHLMVHVSTYRKSSREVTIAVAEDYSSIEKEFGIFLWWYILISAAALLVLIMVQAWVVRSGLRPLDEVRHDVAKLEHGEINRLTTKVPQEVSPLVQEINRMLQLMVSRLQRSRHALGNVAHALKAPLTVLMQVVQGRDMDDRPQLREQLSGQLKLIDEIIQRELKRARLAGAGEPGRRFMLDAELPALVNTLRQLHRDKNLVIDYAIPPDMKFAGDREDMLELLGNLLDNACKWAGGRVHLTVYAAPGFAFTVEDDGPGVSEADLEQITHRGVRMDESVSGHGLGLAIVREIIEQYAGEFQVSRSEVYGGLRVEVRLPDTTGNAEG